jgi:peptidoglycan hydrolase CwlO-like protein
MKKEKLMEELAELKENCYDLMRIIKEKDRQLDILRNWLMKLQKRIEELEKEVKKSEN